MDEKYIVYIKIDDENRIIATNSSAFLTDTTDWIEIDSGYSNKYHHAQGNYLDKPIIDERGIYRYKLEDGKVIERTQEEMEADYKPPIVQPTTEERVAQLEEAFNLLLDGATE